VAIRAHLRKYHGDDYRDAVISEQLKGWRTIDGTTSTLHTASQEREPFSLEGFYERLVSWVVVDDQVCDI
jgi:hypothetical protein